MRNGYKTLNFGNKVSKALSLQNGFANEFELYDYIYNVSTGKISKHLWLKEFIMYFSNYAAVLRFYGSYYTSIQHSLFPFSMKANVRKVSLL